VFTLREVKGKREGIEGSAVVFPMQAGYSASSSDLAICTRRFVQENCGELCRLGAQYCCEAIRAKTRRTAGNSQAGGAGCLQEGLAHTPRGDRVHDKLFEIIEEFQIAGQEAPLSGRIHSHSEWSLGHFDSKTRAFRG
jgi:hypothetical protein